MKVITKRMKLYFWPIMQNENANAKTEFLSVIHKSSRLAKNKNEATGNYWKLIFKILAV